MCFSWRHCSTNLTSLPLILCTWEQARVLLFFHSCFMRVLPSHLALPVSWLGVSHLLVHGKVFPFCSCKHSSQRPLATSAHFLSTRSKLHFFFSSSKLLRSFFLSSSSLVPSELNSLLQWGHSVSCPSTCHFGQWSSDEMTLKVTFLSLFRISRELI